MPKYGNLRNTKTNECWVVKVVLAKDGQICDLTSQLAKIVSNETHVDPNTLVVADIFNARFHKIFSPNESLSSIMDRDDIFVYELPMLRKRMVDNEQEITTESEM